MRKSKNIATSIFSISKLTLLLLAFTPGCVGSAGERMYDKGGWDTDTYYDEIEEDWDAYHEDYDYDYEDELGAGVPEEEDEVVGLSDGDEHWQLYSPGEKEDDDQCICRIEEDYYQSPYDSQVCRYESTSSDTKTTA